ncbi:methylated-DNA--[Blastococcus sp. TML/M2B]|uniref:methylated-DNA--[protein]-cysteine S-methyltransferase n=1 Tax=unclassified Blastococcus TaxID=2619396 RepID=UPI00190AEE2C|nr:MULTISPECIES: methylated-DNA--[protein]-cysteine S-methyltransferase [unclassified Blastococcus]MBN1091650.1 methylated-DNA--[protein]-cysteine S-methyltransferase [Blastococcus sp. TML/M2B]MBN1094793.1 methylated-DNA--[protein]-cysteine S-methyltransferase [Blastococcus sp. TML/C7B]
MTARAARYATVPTPPGPFTVVVADGPGDDDVVLASGWTDDVAELLPVVHRSLRPTWVERADDLPVLEAVEAFFAGDVAAIDDVPVRQRSGPFLEDAWTVLRSVPPGEPDTYTSFAARCGRPTAVRAAASACARNAAALFVPCHRVLASSGGLGGFRWGTAVKRELLDHEARHAPLAVA